MVCEARESGFWHDLCRVGALSAGRCCGTGGSCIIRQSVIALGLLSSVFAYLGEIRSSSLAMPSNGRVTSRMCVVFPSKYLYVKINVHSTFDYFGLRL